MTKKLDRKTDYDRMCQHYFKRGNTGEGVSISKGGKKI